MNLVNTAFEEVKIVEPKVYKDERGYFFESYSKKKFLDLGLDYDFLQDNYSLSMEAGTLRGLHFQNYPDAQTKIARVTNGAILDVVVDIRKGSPTFGKHLTTILSADNFRQIIIPKGFAHGILTLVPNTQISYKVDGYYSGKNERVVLWSDPFLDIDWQWNNPILSDKDKNAPLLKDSDSNFIYGEMI